MASSYRVDVYNRSGVRQAILTDFVSLGYSMRVNDVGSALITLDGSHWLIPMLQKDWILEIWRRPDGGSWGLEFTTLFEDIEWQFTDRPVATLRCFGVISLLSRRIVAWYANTASRSAFTGAKAETIAKTLVRYNLGAYALITNGRLCDGVMSGITFETDSGRGNTLDWYCAYDNLLYSLQDLALVGGGDFSLDKVTVGNYRFTWHDGQLGADLRSKLIFAMNMGNMANPSFSVYEQGAAFRAIVGGQGEDNARQISVVDSAIRSTPDRDAELFVDATDVETSAGLQDRGNKALIENAPRTEFKFSIIQTPRSRYGIDYKLGDLVTAINPYNSANYSAKIVSVGIGFDNESAETITAEVAKI